MKQRRQVSIEKKAALHREFQPLEPSKIPSSPLDASVLRREADEGKVKKVYAAREAFRPPTAIFPKIFSGATDLHMTVDDLKDELELVVEMREGHSLLEGTYLYSLRVLEPAPFKVGAVLGELLGSYPSDVQINARAGYVIHEGMYAMAQEEGKIQPLIKLLLGSAHVVEVKARRIGNDPLKVNVTLE